MIIHKIIDLEYKVLEELGHGGFGTVYKVRNRVDSRLYALKKVKLNPDNETLNERIMREVKLLSRLNHENVIRYYTAWNETETYEISDNSNKQKNQSIDNVVANESTFNGSTKINNQWDISGSSDDEADDIYHTSYLISDKNIERVDVGETSDSYVVFDTSDNNKDENEIVESMKKALGPNLSDDESDTDMMDSTNQVDPINKLRVNRWLYIQMELGQGTLHEAIDLGLPKNKDRARRFFREILDGLCHIHRQGIIHRDLKPVNIFLDSMDRPKIGDFGLATSNLFIVTQNNSPGVHTATAIKPNRISLEKLRLLATPEQLQGGSIDSKEMNRSGERLKYIQYNQTDNIGTPLYMSPELSATSEKTRIAKVVYSHKVDVYSLGIIYFEMLYPFATGHERIISLQELRKNSIKMPADVETHLSKEDIELIRLLVTHDVAARPTSEKLLSSNLLPSIGLKEREYQNIIKQVVQNPQARTHKHMLRLLFEQNDSYLDDFVFDYEDTDFGASGTAATPTKSEAQTLLKDFTTNTIVLDQVKMRMELLFKSRGFIQYSTPTLMPKYTASKYYSRQQIDDVVMLMDKNSSILTLPYDLRLPFARNIARANINYMSRFSIEKIFRQRQILGYHPDQLWECCLDIVTPPLTNGLDLQSADAEIINLIGEVIKAFPMLYNLRPTIKMNDIRLVRNLIKLVLNMNNNNNQTHTTIGTRSPSFRGADPGGVDVGTPNQDEQIDAILSCISESLNISFKKTQLQTSNMQHQHQHHHSIQYNTSSNSLPSHVKEDLKRDLAAKKLMGHTSQSNSLITLLDVAANNPHELLSQYEQLVTRFNSRSGNKQTTTNINLIMDEIRVIIRIMDELICYATGLGLELPLQLSAGYVLNALRPVNFYSGMVCLLECRRYSKLKPKFSKPSSLSSSQHKTVILAVGGRYDKLIEKFSRNRREVFDPMRRADSNAGGPGGNSEVTSNNSSSKSPIVGLGNNHHDGRPKTAVGVSFEVEKFARFVLEDYVDKVINDSDQIIVTPSIQQLVRLNFSLGAAANAQWPWACETGANIINKTQTGQQQQQHSILTSTNTNTTTTTIGSSNNHLTPTIPIIISPDSIQTPNLSFPNFNNQSHNTPISGISFASASASTSTLGPLAYNTQLQQQQQQSSSSSFNLQQHNNNYQQQSININNLSAPNLINNSSINSQLTSTSFIRSFPLTTHSTPLVSNNFGTSLCIRFWPLDLAICSMAHPKSKLQITIIASIIRQLRDKGVVCNELMPSGGSSSFELDSLMMLCRENRIPYVLTMKCQQQQTSLDLLSASTSASSIGANSSIIMGDDHNHHNTSSLSSSPGASPSGKQTHSMNNNQNQYQHLAQVNQHSQQHQAQLYNLNAILQSCIVTLYQQDKGRFRELKRTDALSMIDYLVKRY